MNRAKQDPPRAPRAAAHGTFLSTARALATAVLLCLAAGAGAAQDAATEVSVKSGGSAGFARLVVETEPRGATVYIDGAFGGRSPLAIEKFAAGPHQVLVSLEGYREREFVLVASELTEIVITLELEELTGWLLVETDPADARIEIDRDGKQREAGLVELRVGLHRVDVSRFASGTASFQALILEDLVTTLQATLEPAAFRLSELRASRSAFDPRNAGVLGSAELSFDVSSFGEATLEIRDAAGVLVGSAGLGPFSSEAQSYRWDGRAGGEPLPDGEYQATLTARPDPAVELADPEDTLVRNAALRIDSSLAWVPGSLGGAGSGLALMAEPFADPPGLFRASIGAALRQGVAEAAGPDLSLALAYGAEAFSVGAAASLAAGSGDGWLLSAALAWPLAERGAAWGLAATARATGGKGAAAALEWSQDGMAAAAGGFAAGLAAAWGRKGSWLGAQGELGLNAADGVFGWTLALRAGASLGGAAWRLGVSAEQAFDAAFGAGSLGAREPRAAVEAHLMPGRAPLSLSVACEASLGVNLVPAPPLVRASLGIAF
ncbi:MAG TPA: PEGA domain-containing protein [Spirochaetales bacterium]|nr:PEGA domain-containing protein [Spirochaetales bacterium]